MTFPPPSPFHLTTATQTFIVYPFARPATASPPLLPPPTPAATTPRTPWFPPQPPAIARQRLPLAHSRDFLAPPSEVQNRPPEETFFPVLSRQIHSPPVKLRISCCSFKKGQRKSVLFDRQQVKFYLTPPSPPPRDYVSSCPSYRKRACF